VTNPFDLSGRVALVTGATGRLGVAIAGALEANGADVFLTARNADRLEEIAGQLDAPWLAADLTSTSEREALFDRIREERGRLDALVNNAGTGRHAVLGEIRADDFNDVFAINAIAAYLCVQDALALFQPGAKVVNIGSIYATLAPDDRLYADAPEMIRASAPYLASKGALLQLTRELAVRLAAQGIQVNMVSPGGVEADQPEAFKERYRTKTPAGRLATPQDVVGAVVFLASSAADYVTGQNIVVDGGLSLA
jgi:NAD(P)-dependent dehydrogenase (short-subunit alcohol dehydrogenase family)